MVESNEHVQAIHTLRSGKTVDNRVEMPEDDQRETIFFRKTLREVVKPERENLRKNLKENGEREKNPYQEETHRESRFRSPL